MTFSTRSTPNKYGFTLIELIVTVAIVGLLAAIAYPSYIQYVVKTKRSAAETFMFELANKEEQYLLDKRQYTSTVTDLLAIPADVSTNYQLGITLGATLLPTYTT